MKPCPGTYVRVLAHVPMANRQACALTGGGLVADSDGDDDHANNNNDGRVPSAYRDHVARAGDIGIVMHDDERAFANIPVVAVHFGDVCSSGQPRSVALDVDNIAPLDTLRDVGDATRARVRRTLPPYYNSYVLVRADLSEYERDGDDVPWKSCMARKAGAIGQVTAGTRNTSYVLFADSRPPRVLDQYADGWLFCLFEHEVSGAVRDALRDARDRYDAWRDAHLAPNSRQDRLYARMFGTRRSPARPPAVSPSRKRAAAAPAGSMSATVRRVEERTARMAAKLDAMCRVVCDDDHENDDECG